MAAAAATSTSKWINKPKLFSSSLPRQLGSCSTTISLKKPNKKQPMSDGIPHSGGGASKEDEEPKIRPAQQSQKSGVGSSAVVDQPRICANHPPLDGIPQSGGGASKEDEEPKIRPVRANLPVKGLMVLLAVIAVVEALPVDTLKSHPITKAATVIVLFAFGSLIVIWLKLEQPRITNGSVCQFLVIRLLLTVGFVCMAFIVSGFIPDGHGWMIYMSVTGTTSCILVAWDIASMFRAAVRAETLNP